MKYAWITTPTTAFVLLSLAGCGGTSDNGYTAEYQCKEFVKDRLKSPSSAEFDTSHSGTEPVYTVTGTVDSQNGFGAMVRNSFTCTVSHSGDRWTLESLNGLEG